MDNEKKQKKAAAISYSSDNIAPTVLAKGKGHVAEKILEKRGDIPVIENKELVDELTKVDIGAYIPPELYEVVAQILIFISDLDKNGRRNG